VDGPNQVRGGRCLSGPGALVPMSTHVWKESPCPAA
jgi:hypothetical protein